MYYRHLSTMVGLVFVLASFSGCSEQYVDRLIDRTTQSAERRSSSESTEGLTKELIRRLMKRKIQSSVWPPIRIACNKLKTLGRKS